MIQHSRIEMIRGRTNEAEAAAAVYGGAFQITKPAALIADLKWLLAVADAAVKVLHSPVICLCRECPTCLLEVALTTKEKEP